MSVEKKCSDLKLAQASGCGCPAADEWTRGRLRYRVANQRNDPRDLLVSADGLIAGAVLHEGDWTVAAAADRLSTATARRALDLLAVGQDPVEALPQILSHLVVQHRSGSIRVITSASFGGGLVYRASPTSLQVSNSISRLLKLQPADLDLTWCAAATLIGPTRLGTAYRGIDFLPAGHELRWQPGSAATVQQWFSLPPAGSVTGTPEQWVEQYLDSLDQVLRETLPEAGGVGAMMSAGLDSTMVVGSAARLFDGEIRAYIHHPVDGTPEPGGRWLLSDLPDAESMTELWPTIVLEPVVNPAGRTLLDTCPPFFDDHRIPMFNPPNTVWMADSLNRGADRGYRVTLSGASGNKTFSWAVDTAGVLDQFRRRTQAGQPAWRVAASLATPARIRAAVRGKSNDETGLRYLQPDYQAPLREEGDRATAARFADFQRSQPVLSSALSLPFSQAGPNRMVDPLSAPALFSLVASLPDEAFGKMPSDRAWARRTMIGRVPDQIRLRTTRGSQAADHVLWWRRSPGSVDRLRERLADVRDFIRVDLVMSDLEQALADDTKPSPWLHRAIGLGLFVAQLRP